MVRPVPLDAMHAYTQMGGALCQPQVQAHRSFFAWSITLEVKLGAHAWQGDRVVLATAVEAGGTPVAGALNLRGSHALFGRNWGCARDVKHLHFELCYYQALEAAIELRLPRVEAGAQVAPGARACPPALHACMRVRGALTALAGRPRRASTRSSAGDATGPLPAQLLTCMLRQPWHPADRRAAVQVPAVAYVLLALHQGSHVARRRGQLPAAREGAGGVQHGGAHGLRVPV